MQFQIPCLTTPRSSWRSLAIASVMAVLLVSPSSLAHGQTLFARPDTTPDYPSYREIEECWSAGERIWLEDRRRSLSIWWDTVEAYAWRQQHKGKVGVEDWNKRRPASAIHAAQMCLKQFNPDTASFVSPFFAQRIVKILLVAEREQEADRFAQRALDSIRRTSAWEYKTMLYKLISEYGLFAQPMQYAKAKQYYERFLAERAKGDSLYVAIDAALELGVIAERAKDTAVRDRAWKLALALNDSMPEAERQKQPQWVPRLKWLSSLAASLTQDEALDSLAKSNVAYELWAANTVKRRVYGGGSVTRDEMVQQYDEAKMKEIQGAHYYVAGTVASPGTSPRMSPQRGPAYTRKGQVPPNALPIKGTVNYFAAFPSTCQIETEGRSASEATFKDSYGCLAWAANIRSLKHEFPDLEIIGLSHTYGTVGQLGPLTPEENADTLAKLFLEFHRLSARLVVENTEFYHLAEPDGRRIDSDTPNSVAMGCQVWLTRCAVFVDKEGHKVTPYIQAPEWFARFYQTLKNRPSK